MDLDKIAIEVLKELDNDTKWRIYETDDNMHFTLGMYIRNKYLWGKYNGKRHVDDVSADILSKVKTMVKEQRLPESRFEKPKVTNENGEQIELPYEIKDALESLNYLISRENLEITILDGKIAVSKSMKPSEIELKDIILDEQSFKDYEIQLDNELIQLVREYKEKFNKDIKIDGTVKHRQNLLKQLKEAIKSGEEMFYWE